jgi:hypothetical protein
MPKKTAGKPNEPPEQADFDALPLKDWCRRVGGVFHRLHSRDPRSGKPCPPVHFSRRGNTRFDPRDGIGSFCLARTLAGALMEVFDDHWGPIGTLGRSVSEQQLRDTFESLIYVSDVEVFDTSGPYLSWIGADAQLLSGDYAITRRWALRLMRHPHQIGGIVYPSRHDLSRENVALFEGRPFKVPNVDPDLKAGRYASWKPRPSDLPGLIHGPPESLSTHPELITALVELKVARLP